jgi:hypothetical protein
MNRAQGSSWQIINDATMFWRFARGLRGFLRDTLTPEQSEQILKTSLDSRQASFLALAKKGIFGIRRSPYWKLCAWAGVEYGDVEKLVRTEGLEATLKALHRAGVYVTLEEFKGRREIRRGNSTLCVRASDFDNPFLEKHFEASTGGSRGVASRLIVDLDLVRQDAAAHHQFLKSFQLEDHPMALWRALPPGAAGMKKALMQVKVGRSTERWFCQNENSLRRANIKAYLFVNFAVLASRRSSHPLPRPEHVPLLHAVEIAKWLAAKTAAGRPAHLDTTVSCGLRICQAAREAGLRLEGTFFRLGGEPLTDSRISVVRSMGCRAVCHYSMAETGPLANACANSEAADEAHIRQDKIAIIQRPVRLANQGTLDSFFITTVTTLCPKIMLNVANGDFGVITERDCGCSFGTLGFHKTVRRIRSYEKLTGEGMHFLGTDLLELLEEVLPASFGGSPSDYQLVEEDRGGPATVRLLVSPRVGDLDEQECISKVFSFLAGRARENRMMSDFWKEAGTLTLQRREPYTTSANKIQPLHIHRDFEQER